MPKTKINKELLNEAKEMIDKVLEEKESKSPFTFGYNKKVIKQSKKENGWVKKFGTRCYMCNQHFIGGSYNHPKLAGLFCSKECAVRCIAENIVAAEEGLPLTLPLTILNGEFKEHMQKYFKRKK